MARSVSGSVATTASVVGGPTSTTLERGIDSARRGSTLAVGECDEALVTACRRLLANRLERIRYRPERERRLGACDARCTRSGLAQGACPSAEERSRRFSVTCRS